MLNPRAAIIEGLFRETIRLHEETLQQAVPPLLNLVEVLEVAFARGGQVLVFGNGGSAADAQHLAAELVWRFVRPRRGLPVIALSTDTSILTAVANDDGYEKVFARQIEALGRAGDVALGISTSGASPNVVAGLKAAKARGLATIALTGRDGGAVAACADLHVNVPHASAARVQEVHRTMLHAICELIDASMNDER